MPARRANTRRLVVTAVLALVCALLPTPALANPPDPATAEVPRDQVTLEALAQDSPVDGETRDPGLARIDQEPPEQQTEAPPGTTTPAKDGAAAVSFDSAVQARALSTTDGDDLVPVGDLPVKIGPAEGAPAPSGTWEVAVSPRTAPEASGIDGALVTVTAPVTGSVPISVELSYQTYENYYGADWASRLEFVQFPECYLTTPDLEECRTYTELETVNDPQAKAVTATVDTAADGVGAPSLAGMSVMAATGDKAVVGAVDSGSGAGGSFKATGLASDGKWEAGGSSGAFTWSYPLQVPPPPAGPAPKISFNYNSQSVDGKTAATSPQSSWLGEGWDYDPGFIERRYRTCKDDRDTTAAGAPNNKDHKTPDLCWVSYNAVMSLAGSTTELVRVGTPAAGEPDLYRPQNDDGTRIERRTGASNGDNDGEYWIVTTRDGTKYYFGQHQVGGSHADTDSVFTVPVYGNHPGEPCHNTAFSDSRCTAADGTKLQQAWRWNLDKVVDVHNNAMIVNWHKSTNYYAVNKKFTSPEKYVRGGYPTSIEYGLRTSDLTTPSAKVVFNAAQRCLQTTGCEADTFDNTADPAAYRPWWDSPGNLNCKSTSDMCPAFPSFWIRMRLGSVTTYGARPGVTGLGKVDTYTLHHSFPRDWYDTSPGLWLNSITRTGYAPGDSTGTLQSKAGVSFAPYVVAPTDPLGGRLKDRQLPNLVPRYAGDTRPAFTRPRIGVVSTEDGGDITVTYSGGCATQPSTTPENNTSACFPMRWSPDGELEKPALAWFNKYVAHSVVETDRISGVSDTISTRYTYTGATWDKSDDEFTKPELRTYNVWRGYQQVATTKGNRNTAGPGLAQTQSYSVARYFRGVGGEVKDSTGKTTLLADDQPQFAGMPAETIDYRSVDGGVMNRTLFFPWSKQTASRDRDGGAGLLLAYRTGIRRTDAIQTIDASWQAVRIVTAVDDTYGLPTQVEQAVVKPDGTEEKLSDYTCSKYEYIHNEAAWLIGLPKSQRTTATSCADYAGADPATQLVSSTRTSYDNQVWGATPTKGLVTSTATINGTGTSDSIVGTASYDPLGRVRTMTDPKGAVTETQYIPADTGGPVTSIKSINAKGHTTTTTMDPGRGLALTVTDPNGRATRTEYDALGRLTKGWSASRSTGTQTPDVMISYQPATVTSTLTKPASVITQALKDDQTTYSKQITLYDGLARPFQTQAEAHGPGRIIADTRYNDHGLPREQTGTYLAKGEPEATQFKRLSNTQVPSISRTFYDGVERPVKITTMHHGTAVYSDFTTYGDNWTLAEPAGGATPAVRTHTDALGRVIRIQHYTNTSLTKSRSTYYSYDARGNRTQVKDHAGNEWNYTFDARGRVTTATDPDTGTSSFGYDDLDRRTSSTNANLETVYTDYDVLGRTTAVREGSKTATPYKEFTFDKPGALGLADSATSHTSAGDFVTRVTGYDTEYRPTGRDLVVPSHATTTGVSGTHHYSYTYTPTGKPLSTTLPAIAGLAQEKVVTRYDSDGLPESTSGLTWYTADVTYSPYGEALRTVSGPQPYRVWTTNFIDDKTGSLQRTVWDRETSNSHRIDDNYYSYDRAGNITSYARKLTDGATSTWDNQCFTYDRLGELAHAWTSNITVGKSGTGCKSANNIAWGYRTDGKGSAGPIAEAPDSVTDAETPDAGLTASLNDAAPATGTVAATGTAYWQSFTYDVIGNRASLTEHNPADPAQDATTRYSYGSTVMDGTGGPTTIQPHTLTRTDQPTGTDPTYRYDTLGNTESRTLPGGTQNLEWNIENKVTQVTGTGDGATAVVGLAGKCIDVQGGATTDGTPVQLYGCNNSTSQQWRLQGDELRNRGKCATVVGTAVQIMPCNGATAQKWTTGANGKLTNTGTAKCLEVPASNTADGTDLQINTCDTSGTAQKWTIADKVTYLYDTSGSRILEYSAAGSTLHLGDADITTDPNGQPIQATRTYTHPGAPSVIRQAKNGSATGHRIYVTLTDHLGTATTTVEQATGQPVTRRTFKPFGETRGTKPAWPDNRGYLGIGIDDTNTGLTHIGAREYDPSVGRFISADPIIDMADPLQMNGYAYSNNSPISSSDPTGLKLASMGDGGGGHSAASYLLGSSDPEIRRAGWHLIFRSRQKDTRPAGDWKDAIAGAVESIAAGGDAIATVTLPGGYFLAQGQEKLRYWAMDKVGIDRSSAAFGDAREVTDAAQLALGAGSAAKLLTKGAAALLKKLAPKLVDEAVEAGTSAAKAAEPPKCFLAGTDILMANGAAKDIEDIRPGDLVESRDPETGEEGPRKVTQLIITEGKKHLNKLSIATEDGIDSVTATREHPFWSPSENEWVSAGDLQPGMTLLTDDEQTVIVTSNKAFTKYVRTYNFTVEDLHTYYVLAGKIAVLVHNDCGEEAARKIRAGLPDRPNGEGPTTGQLVDSAGNTLRGPTRSGGNGADVLEVDGFLKQPNSGMTYINLKARYTAAQHPETQFAMWMRNNGVKRAAAVINNNYVCGFPYGCKAAIPAILPKGYALTIYHDGPEGVEVLYGKSQIPLG
ncbi:hypothetical protein SRB5_64370 [Streptomyces sp. RB5]|uniref:Sugar-binding protein n=1 Tax=Streptomyces smaragdinus TaxID=2585196 RepID=A0A7K0CS02_9ACTN|nr:ricin-type beta-trefoil lectin domain protein [Streptomyces smaragdinus]MQY16239.1 hypothetical protein [Streptomyces smaragdinus]